MVGHCRWENRTRRDSGSVTAETAVLLPVVLLILLAIAGVSVVGSAQVRVQQAAGVIAREQARGVDVSDQVQRLAGDGASVSVSREGGWARVSVRRSVPLWQAVGPGIQVSADAEARVEKQESAGAGG